MLLLFCSGFIRIDLVVLTTRGRAHKKKRKKRREQILLTPLLTQGRRWLVLDVYDPVESFQTPPKLDVNLNDKNNTFQLAAAATVRARVVQHTKKARAP